MLRVGIAALDHEVLDHAVEEQRVECVLLHQLDEVVAVQRRLFV